MKTDHLLHQILPILHSVKDNEQKLQQILDFLMDEIYEEPDEEIEIPEKYQKLVREVADHIDTGMICYINPDTLEMEDVSAGLINDPHEVESLTGSTIKDYQLQHHMWKKCITIEPMQSRESFQIRERFVNHIEDINLRKKVINALRQRHPFARFKELVEYSDYRQKWFAFKQKQLEEYVWEEISFELEKGKSFE